MRIIFATCFCVVLLSLFACGGTAPLCEPGASDTCACGQEQGKRVCNTDGLGYGACSCEADGGGSEPQTTPDASEPAKTGDEPGSSTEPADDAGSTEPTGDAGGAEPSGQCPSGEVLFQDRCVSVDTFCSERFSTQEQEAMASPREVIFSESGRPFFCRTKPGYYYLEVGGYGKCDNDGDGWITIEAYRATTSTEQKIRDNARCKVLSIEAIVYHAENSDPQAAQLQVLDAPVALIETFRNDGGKKLIDMPIYSDKQVALPKARGSACTEDAACGEGEVCYIGNCIKGRRFEPAEINTLTKACIAGLDLNDNQIDDVSEQPSDTPTPAGEFKPLLNLGYFVALHHGHFQADYSDQGPKRAVYHIYERARVPVAGAQQLGLKCQEATDAFRPDHWKRCGLKDDQRCKDANAPGGQRKGLSSCWLPEVKWRVPSLFKCVVFDSKTDPTTQAGTFHPDNYGFDKSFSRTQCSFKEVRNENDPTKRDISLDCSADDGTLRPDASKQQAGWACVSFKPYKTSSDYIGGCQDEIVEQICGDKDVNYITLEHKSYGLARANRECGQSTGVGACSAAKQICTGGTWLPCNQCDNCPNDTPGNQAACPNKTWPITSCKPVSKPDAEKCDGLDNDCDGQVDEGLVEVTYYKDADGDSFGDPTQSLKRCPQQQPKGYVANKDDCNDADDKIKPGVTDRCDGVDNNCDGKIDEGNPTKKYYEDNDLDNFGGKFAFEGCTTVTGSVCVGKADCRQLTYAFNGLPTSYKTKGGDCCDTDQQSNPDQTAFFSKPNACNSFDWNCDGKESSKEPRCKCTRKVTFTESGSASCSFGGHRSWHSRTTPGSVTNASCEFDFTHSYAPSVDKRLNYSCVACSRSTTISKEKARLNITPKDKLGGFMITFPTSEYKLNCAYKNDGTLPKCGEVATLAGAKESGAQVVSTSKTAASGRLKCGVCSGSSYSCSSSYKITYSSSIVFARKSVATRLVQCN